MNDYPAASSPGGTPANVTERYHSWAGTAESRTSIAVALRRCRPPGRP
jgi:hypothetical protein